MRDDPTEKEDRNCDIRDCYRKVHTFATDIGLWVCGVHAYIQEGQIQYNS